MISSDLEISSRHFIQIECSRIYPEDKLSGWSEFEYMMSVSVHRDFVTFVYGFA